MITDPRTARQGVRAERRRLPPRRRRPADRRAARAPASCSAWRTARGRRGTCASWSRPRSRSPSGAPRENAAPVSEQSLKQARREIGKEIQGSLTQEQREALETITGPGRHRAARRPRRHRQGRRDLRRREGVAARGHRGDRHRDCRRDRATAPGRREASTAPTPPTSSSTASRTATSGSGRTPSSSWTRPGWPTPSASSRLAELTAERDSKLVLAGDAAQLSPIGAGGLFQAAGRPGPHRRADRGPPRQPRVGATSLGADQMRANPAPRSRNTKPTTACTSTTPAPRQPRRWSRTGTRPARAWPTGRR